MQNVCVCHECHHVFSGHRQYHYEGEIFCSLSCRERYILKYSWPDDRQISLPLKIPIGMEKDTQAR